MRRTRKKYVELSPEQQVKCKARTYARIALERGKIEPCGCEVCASKAEMHHDDYDQPLNVRWLCRTHHLDLHYQLSNRVTK